MKRAAVILGILGIAIWAEARNSGEAAPHNPPAAGQAAPAQGDVATGKASTANQDAAGV